MTEYFLKLANKSKLVNNSLTEIEIINNLIQHYPPHIRNHLIVAKPIVFAEIIDLLGELEVHGRQEVPFSKSTPNEQPCSSSPQGEKKENSNENVNKRNTQDSKPCSRENLSQHYRNGPLNNSRNIEARNRYSGSNPWNNRDRNTERRYQNENGDNRGRGYNSQVNYLRFYRRYNRGNDNYFN